MEIAAAIVIGDGMTYAPLHPQCCFERSHSTLPSQSIKRARESVGQIRSGPSPGISTWVTPNGLIASTMALNSTTANTGVVPPSLHAVFPSGNYWRQDPRLILGTKEGRRIGARQSRSPLPAPA